MLDTLFRNALFTLVLFCVSILSIISNFKLNWLTSEDHGLSNIDAFSYFISCKHETYYVFH